MTIWLLALLLLASLASLGLRQGAIRVAFSLVGILVGALLAVPLGGLIKPLLGLVGMKSPVLVWAVAPFVIFVLISIIFKSAAAAVHHKVDVHFKYHAGELRLALWERLSHRLGLCLGLLNGVVYLILIVFVIYSFSYWTVQMSSAENDPTTVRLLNRLGQDLQSSGFNRVARAVDGKSEAYYDAADINGLMYRNPLLEARLRRYPGFLGLAERPEFQALADDQQFAQMRQAQEPIKSVLDYPKTQAIVDNPELLNLIWDTVVPDLLDLKMFLETGKSRKYDRIAILGRWQFDINAAINMLRRAKPTTPSGEMLKLKKGIALAFAKTTFVAMPDKRALLKGFPRITKMTAASSFVAPPTELQTLAGQWKDLDTKYDLSLPLGGVETSLSAVVEGDRLTIKGDDLGLVFNRED